MDVLLGRARRRARRRARERSARPRRSTRELRAARRRRAPRSSRSPQASGLALVAPEERDAEAASSAGTGELIAAAVEAGARRVLVAAGGSATTDGGARRDRRDRRRPGGLRGARLTVLCDVRTPFEQAAAVFGPQKGADPAAVVRLERRGSSAFGLPRGVPMTGAAGGLAGGLWCALGARARRRARRSCSTRSTSTRGCARARAVIVGEGRLDATSLAGQDRRRDRDPRAPDAACPAHAIVGSCALERFDARILDLQEILEAGDEPALEAAAAALVPRDLSATATLARVSAETVPRGDRRGDGPPCSAARRPRCRARAARS